MNTIKHKKVRTLKDLQNHPLVESVVREEQSDFYYDWETRTEKESKYQYWVYLKIGYWFEKEGVTSFAEPTAKFLLDRFNETDAKIGLDPREGWRLEDQI
tara:strand:+ start:547 stop:846 length:300 start_codon:yes stop_codon:yes gene_type:complete